MARPTNYQAALSELARDPINVALPDPAVARDIETGAVWEYLGPTDDGKGEKFRHNCHPVTAARVDITINLEAL